MAIPPFGAVVGAGLGETVKSKRDVKSFTDLSGDARREEGLGRGREAVDLDIGLVDRTGRDAGVFVEGGFVVEPFPVEL